MPRLVGKQSSGGASAILLLLIAIGVAGALEYEGVINVVPGFGEDSTVDRDHTGVHGLPFSRPFSKDEPGATNVPTEQLPSSQPSTSPNPAQ
jgi:hypothetical protein